MRYPPDHRQKTYERILDAAAVVFRRHGYQASSVDQVMNEAGLTPGGFYALAFADGFVRVGVLDRRGATFEPKAPDGDVRLVRIGSSGF